MITHTSMLVLMSSECQLAFESAQLPRFIILSTVTAGLCMRTIRQRAGTHVSLFAGPGGGF